MVSGPALPLWSRLTLLATALWPFFWSFCFGRRGDPRAFAIVPVSINLVASALGIQHVLHSLSLTGRSPRATAAGLAEALLPLAIGTGFTGLLTLLIFMRRRWPHASRSTGITILGVSHVALVAGLVAFARLIQRVGVFSAGLDHASLLLIGAASVSLVSSLIMACTPIKGSPVHRFSWCVALFLASVTAAGVIVFITESLRVFARGGS